MDDLYEFPRGYVGRKTYVHVEGHRRSVPVIHTYKGTDRRNHILPAYGGNTDHFAHGRGPTIMRDIAPFVSPVDGSYITSRSAKASHVRQHDLIEVGSERWPERKPPEMPRAGTDIKRAMQQHGV